MKLIVTLSLLLAATPSLANPFPKGDAATGQKLFEKHNCNRCHAQIMGGDGNAIFTRPNRRVRDVAGMISQMDACGDVAGTHLKPHEKQHIGAYLNRYYDLK